MIRYAWENKEIIPLTQGRPENVDFLRLIWRTVEKRSVIRIRTFLKQRRQNRNSWVRKKDEEFFQSAKKRIKFLQKFFIKIACNLFLMWPKFLRIFFIGAPKNYDFSHIKMLKNDSVSKCFSVISLRIRKIKKRVSFRI